MLDEGSLGLDPARKRFHCYIEWAKLLLKKIKQACLLFGDPTKGFWIIISTIYANLVEYDDKNKLKNIVKLNLI